MKLFKLGQRDYRGTVNTPSLSDLIFSPSSSFRNEFKLLLDLLDETWVLEHHTRGSSGFHLIRTTAIVRVNQFND